MAKTYLDSAGLQTFLTNLKTAYAGNDTNVFSTFTVGQAGKLANARTVTFATGDVTGSFSFDGSANVSNVVLSVADAVASSSGEGGSHGLMTAAQAEKLAGVASGAQVNVLEGVQIKNNGDSDFSDLTISSKKVQIDLSGYALKTDITAVMKFKGTKTSDQLAALTGMVTGDVYSIVSGGTGDTYKVGSEYAYDGSAWVELGPVIDLSGYALKTQEINGHALSGDITLDGSDIALSTSYAKASSSAAVAASDSIDTAVGKLEKKVDDNASAISSLQSGAKSYAFAEGSVNGAFQVTETTGSTAGAAQSIAIHGLGSAAYTASSDYVSSSLTPAEAGAQVNDIEIVKFKGNGDSSAAPLTITNKAVTIDVSGYALTSSLGTAAAANTTDFVSSTLTPAEAGAQANVIETVKVNGSALTPDADKAVDITIPAATVTDVQFKGKGDSDFATALNGTVAKIDVSGYALTTDLPTQATAIADSDTGYATGDQVYDYIETLPISTATINGLFGISNS